MIADSLTHVPNVRIVSISTLLVNVARDVNATAIVQGLRAVSDFESETADGPDEPLALGRGDAVSALEFAPLLLSRRACCARSRATAATSRPSSPRPSPSAWPRSSRGWRRDLL